MTWEQQLKLYIMLCHSDSLTTFVQRSTTAFTFKSMIYVELTKCFPKLAYKHICLQISMVIHKYLG